MNMRLRVALLAIAAALATASVTAAEVEKKPDVSQAEIEKKLEDARRRLDTAAREVAKASGRVVLADHPGEGAPRGHGAKNGVLM